MRRFRNNTVHLAGLIPALALLAAAGIQPAYSENDDTGELQADTCRLLNMPYDSIQPDSNFRELTNDAFGPGESFKYDLKYGFVTAGYAEIRIDSMFTYRDRDCLLVTTTARSHRFFDSFFKVRDRGESWLDAYGLFPWHFEKHLREGGYKRDEVQEFDQFRGLVYEESDTTIAPDYIQDVLSSLFYVRTFDLDVGDRVFVSNYTKKKCYDLEVIVHCREDIEVEAGRFRCLKIEPLLKSAGLFKHEGKLSVWLTDDRLKMPVLMKTKVLVGSISAELTEFTLGELY
jgi:hypothetical protein